MFIAFAGETVLAAALRVAERSQTHCYLSTYTASARTLTYTDAWSDSGISAVTLRGGAIPDATTAAIIDLGVVSDGYDIVNRVYPYGKAADGSRFDCRNHRHRNGLHGQRRQQLRTAQCQRNGLRADRPLDGVRRRNRRQHRRPDCRRRTGLRRHWLSGPTMPNRW